MIFMILAICACHCSLDYCYILICAHLSTIFFFNFFNSAHLLTIFEHCRWIKNFQYQPFLLRILHCLLIYQPRRYVLQSIIFTIWKLHGPHILAALSECNFSLSSNTNKLALACRRTVSYLNSLSQVASKFVNISCRWNIEVPSKSSECKSLSAQSLTKMSSQLP